MGTQKRIYEQTLPVTGKMAFQKELDMFLLEKEKTQKINQQSKPKNNGK